MAKTVNYAGTVLGLNTEKYTKSLQTLKTQSASCANSIKNSFKGMAAGLAGAFSAVASFNKIVNSLKDYESKVSSLSAITGNIEDAKLLFALNMALCDSEGNRTEKDENYSLLCDLPNDLLQKLLEENTKLLTMSESEKKISDADTAD